jgi:hypothetical protein
MYLRQPHCRPKQCVRLCHAILRGRLPTRPCTAQPSRRDTEARLADALVLIPPERTPFEVAARRQCVATLMGAENFQPR